MLMHQFAAGLYMLILLEYKLSLYVGNVRFQKVSLRTSQNF